MDFLESKIFFIYIALLSSPGIEAPTLSFIELTVKNNIHDVAIVWNDNNMFSDIEYILSVSNSSSPTRKPVEFVTTMMRKSLTLYAGVQYNISITAERCGGNLTSNFSAELTLYFEGLFFSPIIGRTYSYSGVMRGCTQW